MVIALPAAILSFTIFLLIPQDANAWGPATHLEVGINILRDLNSIAPGVAPLIEKFSYDFLYGNISADIVVGKNLVDELKHCHNWNFGFKLLRRAESDSQKAFAYGYLSHLAADTVAHNHFIPEMMVRSFSARIMRHIYWEMRFDALADKRVWKIPDKIAKSVHQDNDRLLSSVLEGTPLSFRTSKTIFSSFLNLHRIEHWHRMINLLSSSSKWVLHKKDKDRFFKLSLDAAKDVLSRGRQADCLKKDPVGRKNLQHAKTTRKKLKAVKRQGKNWEELLERSLKGFSQPT